jgi:hypothetical protein
MLNGASQKALYHNAHPVSLRACEWAMLHYEACSLWVDGIPQGDVSSDGKVVSQLVKDPVGRCQLLLGLSALSWFQRFVLLEQQQMIRLQFTASSGPCWGITTGSVRG